MTDPKFRRLRVLHLVGADGRSAPNPMLVPLLARGNRQRIESQVVTFSIGDPRLAVVRQSGLPVHEMALSRQRFSPGAFLDAKNLVARFKPDVLHAWGSTAQLLATAQFLGNKLLTKPGKESIPIVWSVSRTAPLVKKDGWLERRKFAFNKAAAARCQRIVYPSAVAAANHRRAGLPEDLSAVIASGVDAERFKPDDAARQRVRQQLELPQDAILVGMYAPFAPEYDHHTFFKSIGDLIRINTHLYCVVAGRGTVKGNAPLSAMIGGGAMGTRVRLAGEWTDLSALFNACDVVCSTATTDTARLTLAMSMLCGVMCVATTVGAQGEVIGNYGASMEPGSPEAMTRGVRRILDMPADRKAFMAQQARNHILQNFNIAGSIEKYHQLYAELATGVAPAAAAEVKAADQSGAIEIITKRAAAMAARVQAPAVQPAVEKPVANESDRTFGTVEQNAESVQARQVVAPSFTDTNVLPDTNSVEKKANFNARRRFAEENPGTTFNFDALMEATASKPKAEAAAPSDQSLRDSAHWSENDAQLLDEIMTEADPTLTKANADKAAAAAKSSAAKAAASAAFAAALAANADASKTLDPKALAALGLGGLAPGGSSPRAVAGKPPPAPTTKAPTSK